MSTTPEIRVSQALVRTNPLENLKAGLVTKAQEDRLGSLETKMNEVLDALGYVNSIMTILKN